MRKSKLFKKILAFMLVMSFIMSNNIFTVFAQTNVTTGDGDTNTYFKANLFDYDRDVMNQITMDMVAEDIQLAIDNGELEGATLEKKSELRRLYPSMLFITSTDVGKKQSTYTYEDPDTRNKKNGIVNTKDFNKYYEGYCLFNRNNSGKKRGTSYQGLVKKNLGSDGLPVFDVYTADLFDVDDDSNKQIYKDTDVQFELTDDGYYLFDSCVNKYKLEDGKVNIKETDLSKTGQGYGYVPFGDGDYHFGMDLSIDFMMPEDGKYNDDDCVFEFSGDDDVWVYIDGKLALELGGIHYRSDGNINFATQTVTYLDSTNNDGTYCETSRTVSFSSLGLNTNDNGTHNLRVFYVERGASQSNCKIKFNMPTINENEEIKGDYTFKKLDSDTEETIEGAEFTLYSDSSLSDVVATAKSLEDGTVKFSDLKTGEYYLRETGVPEGYKSSTIKTYKLIVAGNSSETLTFTLIDLETNQVVSDNVVYNEPIDNHVDVDKTAKLVDWTQRIYKITLKANAYKPLSEDDVLASDANARPNQILSGTVIDIIDNRFELTDESKAFLIEDGAIIEYNNDGTTTITWHVDSLLNWERSFNIKARESYVGGNDITTNDPNSRVIIEGQDEPVPFPQPKVNVRISIMSGESEDTIFLGQSLERYFTDNQCNALYNDENRDARDVCIAYRWKQIDANGAINDVTGSLEQFKNYIRSLSPENNTNYYLQIYATPKVADDSQEALSAAASMNEEEDEVLFTASMQVPEDAEQVKFVRVTGIYHIYVVDGQITVNKKYDYSFLTGLIYSKEDIEAIEARQTAIFTVYRYAEGTSVEDISNGIAEPIESYDITITGDGNQTITGLRAGMYKVVENTNWTWKYNASVQEANDSSTDGIFYIGKESPSASIVDSENVSFENSIDREMSKIYSDTTNVLNIFLGE